MGTGGIGIDPEVGLPDSRDCVVVPVCFANAGASLTCFRLAGALSHARTGSALDCSISAGDRWRPCGERFCEDCDEAVEGVGDLGAGGGVLLADRDVGAG